MNCAIILTTSRRLSVESVWKLYQEDCLIFGRPLVKRFALCYRTAVLSVLSLSCPICDVGVFWPNGWTDHDETLHACRPRPWPHCLRWRPSSPFSKGAGRTPPPFSAHICCGQMAGWIKMPLGVDEGLDLDDFVSTKSVCNSQYMVTDQH